MKNASFALKCKNDLMPVAECISLSRVILAEWQTKYGYSLYIIERFTKHICATYYKGKNRLSVSGAMLRYPDYLTHALGVLFEEAEE